MVSKNVTAGPVGALAVLVGALMPIALAVAVFIDGTWTFDVNTLSDLGISANSTAAGIFKYSCVICGVLTAIFGIVKAYKKPGYDRATAILLVIAAVFLIAVGLVTKDYDAHTYFAYIYFLMMALAIVISMVADGKNQRNITAIITAILVVIVIGSAVGFTKAGVEVIAVVCSCIWLMAQGMSIAFSKN